MKFLSFLFFCAITSLISCGDSAADHAEAAGLRSANDRVAENENVVNYTFSILEVAPSSVDSAYALPGVVQLEIFVSGCESVGDCSVLGRSVITVSASNERVFRRDGRSFPPDFEIQARPAHKFFKIQLISVGHFSIPYPIGNSVVANLNSNQVVIGSATGSQVEIAIRKR